jgi:hypothetical protein
MAVPTNNNQEEPWNELEISDDEDIDIKDVQVLPEPQEFEPKSLSFNVVEKQEDTRGRLALVFLIGFFVCLIGVSIVALFGDTPEGETKVDVLREAVLAVSGVLSGPLGFIIGYYFRKTEE